MGFQNCVVVVVVAVVAVGVVVVVVVSVKDARLQNIFQKQAYSDINSNRDGEKK